MAVCLHVLANTRVNLNLSVLNAVMSAEPGRKAPYSKDVGWHVVWQRNSMELPFRKITRNLNLSLGTVHNMYKQFEQTGDIPRNKPL